MKTLHTNLFLAALARFLRQALKGEMFEFWRPMEMVCIATGMYAVWGSSMMTGRGIWFLFYDPDKWKPKNWRGDDFVIDELILEINLDMTGMPWEGRDLNRECGVRTVIFTDFEPVDEYYSDADEFIPIPVDDSNLRRFVLAEYE